MKITINVTQQELENMGVTQEELTLLVMDQVDATVHDGKNILHQVELEVESKVCAPRGKRKGK